MNWNVFQNKINTSYYIDAKKHGPSLIRMNRVFGDNRFKETSRATGL